MPPLKGAPTMTSSPDIAKDDALGMPVLDMVAAAAGTESDLMSVSVMGDKIVLQGYVRSYEGKRQAEAAARQAGFLNVENCLRVVPGAAAPPSPT